MSKKKVNPLKLYLVSIQYPPHVIDLEGKILKDFALHLKRNGEEINFCTLGIGNEIEEEKIYDPNLSKKKDRNPIILLRFLANDSKSIKNPYEGLKSEELRRFKSITKPIAEFVGIQQGIIHLHGNNVIPNISKIIKDDLHLIDETGSRKKIISTIYDLESFELKTDPTVNPNVLKEIQLIESNAFKFSDRIIVNRFVIKERLREILKKDFDEDKIVYLPLPVNQVYVETEVNSPNILQENRKNLGIWEDSKIIYCATSSETTLGINLLLNNTKDVFKDINDKITLIITIDSKRKSNLYDILNEKIKSLKKSDRIQVKLLNLTQDEDILKIIDDAELYFAQSDQEKYDMNLLEAWSRGKPVIAFNTKSNLEFFGLEKITSEMNSNDFGILIEINDNSLKLLNKSINILLNDPKKMKLIGKNVKNRILEKYSWEQFISKYYEIYKN